MLLHLVIGPHLIRKDFVKPAVMAEKEVLRLAWHIGRPIRPIDVTQQLDVDFRTARKWLQALVDKNWLQPISSRRGVLFYELKESAFKQL